MLPLVSFAMGEHLPQSGLQHRRNQSRSANNGPHDSEGYARIIFSSRDQRAVFCLKDCGVCTAVSAGVEMEECEKGVSAEDSGTERQGWPK